MITDGMKIIAIATIVLTNMTFNDLLADDWGSDDGWDSWNEKELFDISGYLESTVLTVIPRRSDSHSLRVGLQNLLRLRCFFDPSANLSVTVEGDYLDRRGITNPSARSEMVGIPSTPEESSNQMNSANSSGFKFDYVYGSLSYGLLDLRIGKQPIAWGTAYAFNPTDLANPSYLSELAGIEPPGLTAVSSSITLTHNWAIEGYVGFEDRNRSSDTASELTAFKDHPLGLRWRSFFGAWDLSIGYIRSMTVQQHDQQSLLSVENNAMFEFVGSAAGVTLYGEATVSLDNFDINAEKSINASLGLQYYLFDDYGLQFEYHRRGQGKSDPDDYDANLRLRGSMAARDYLISVIDFMMLNDDIRVVISSLANLNDQSMVLFPSLTYHLIQDFEIEFGGSMFTGKNKSEFDGRFDIRTDENSEKVGIDIGRPQFYLSSTWYF